MIWILYPAVSVRVQVGALAGMAVAYAAVIWNNVAVLKG